MKKSFLLLGIILLISGLLIFQYVKAQTPDDFSINLELMNRSGDTYEVTKCGPPTYFTLVYTQQEHYVCTDEIVPGTLDAIVCTPIHTWVPNELTPCCKKLK